jgi:hypothetical protein
MIARGMDMFDCVLPTRLARNGTAFTSTGTLNLKNAEFAMDKRPIEENCACPSCREFTRGYVRHLVKAEEILGLRLITLHNLHFYLDLMRQARDAIENGSFDSFRKQFVGNYKTRDLDVVKLWFSTEHAKWREIFRRNVKPQKSSRRFACLAGKLWLRLLPQHPTIDQPLVLRGVALHFFDIGADDGADEVAAAIVNGIGAKESILRAIAIRP